MTPAIQALQKSKITHTLHTYDHDPACRSYGEEAAEKLGLDSARVLKTLVVQCDNNKLVVTVIPVAKNA